jgi:hypothetical protein
MRRVATCAARLTAFVVALATSFSSAAQLAVQDAPRAPAAPAKQSLFAPLRGVPADCDLWIRLVDLDAWCADPAGASLMDAFFAIVSGTMTDAKDARAAGTGWPSIADRLGLAPIDAARRYFGKEVRFLARLDEATDPQWVLLARMDERGLAELVERLRPIVRGDGRFELPEDRLAFTYRTPWLVVARSLEEPLFRHFADRPMLEAGPELERSLAETFAKVEPETLAPGQMAIALATSGPLAGRMAMTVSLKDGALAASMRGDFDVPPLPEATQMRLDASILAAFDGPAIAAMIDPIRPSALSSTEAFVVATLPEIKPSAAFQANFGRRRLVLVGEIDGARLERPLAMRCPAIAVAYEVDDGEQAIADQDRYVLGVLDGLRAKGIGVPPPTVPNDPAAVRTARTTPALVDLLGDHPLVRSTTLAWSTVRGPSGAWQVYATDPTWLATVAKTLATTDRVRPAGGARPLDGAAPDCDGPKEFAHAGRCRGKRLASHLRTWTGEAPAFAGDDAEGFSRGVELLATVADRFELVSWTVERPSAQRIDLTIKATLDAVTTPVDRAPRR